MRKTDPKTRARQTWILTLLIAGALFAACTQESAPPPEVKKEAPVVEKAPQPWAILYAFAQEGEEVIGSSTIVTEKTWAGRKISSGWLIQPVVIASTGIGMSNAAATTQHIIDTYKPQGIILTGVCGAVDPKLRIGDIVIPDRWVTHDYGFWGDSGLETDSLPVGRSDTAGFDRMIEIPVDTALARQLGNAADGIAFRFKKVGDFLPDVYKGGVGVSGNAFIGSQRKRQSLYKELKARIVDMESAAVVQTAYAAGIPVVIVRANSDLAGGGSGNAEEEFRQNFEAAAYNAALVVKQFLEVREGEE